MKTSRIGSLCTVATFEYRFELSLLINSFTRFSDAPVYVVCDRQTESWLADQPFNQRLVVIPELDSAVGDLDALRDSTKPEFKPAFSRLLVMKTEAMKAAIRGSQSTLYADSDIVFLRDPGEWDLQSVELILSAHDIDFQVNLQCGIYNAGYVASNSLEFCEWWCAEQQKKDEYDQICLEQAPKKFTTSTFTGKHNIGWWQTYHGPRGLERLESLRADGGIIKFEDEPLLSVHTHFINNCWFPNARRVITDFNEKLISAMKSSTDSFHLELVEIIEKYRVEYLASKGGDV